uniref:Ig-like domain-containing protein n=1 Tax=Steinernema glaseri TaxID=37863 RepID=A0A1I7XWN4_9BILA
MGNVDILGRKQTKSFGVKEADAEDVHPALSQIAEPTHKGDRFTSTPLEQQVTTILVCFAMSGKKDSPREKITWQVHS